MVIIIVIPKMVYDLHVEKDSGISKKVTVWIDMQVGKNIDHLKINLIGESGNIYLYLIIKRTIGSKAILKSKYFYNIMIE